jgi:hypothetical protein
MRNRLVYFTTIAVLLAALPGLAVSQQDSSQTKAAAAGQQTVPRHYYKLNFVLREMDEGKILNQRTFTLNISAEPPHVGGVPPEWWNVRSGTRVPVSGSKDINYIDVGVNLDVRAEEVAEGLQMQITSEISSVGAESGIGVTAPAIRQVKVRSAVLASIGKAAVVFTADDPASKHRFELEVTPMRER